MKYNDEVTPDNLGGLGDMLPAEVLNKLNGLLEQLHQADGNHHGSTVIYALITIQIKALCCDLLFLQHVITAIAVVRLIDLLSVDVKTYCK